MHNVEVVTLTKTQLEDLLEESATRALRKFREEDSHWMQRQTAASYLDIDPNTLDKYTIRDGIPYHSPRNSKLKLYNKIDLDAWCRGQIWK